MSESEGLLALEEFGASVSQFLRGWHDSKKKERKKKLHLSVPPSVKIHGSRQFVMF